MSDSLADALATSFRQFFGRDPRVALAPGRVNLIGEHTDYNDGFVLPMAIDHAVAAAFVPRDDDRIHAFSPDFDAEATLQLDDLQCGAHDGWTSYVAGVAWAMQQDGLPVRGVDLAIRGDVPIGAGLSSSAALEMAVGLALTSAAGGEWDPVHLAQLGRRAENDYVGVSSGIMDQFASAACVEGSALLLDCRSLETEPVPLPEETCIVIMDTGVRRELTNGAYNERVDACEQAVAVIHEDHPEVKALRDVSPEMLAQYEDRIPPVAFRRATHVVHENQRPVLLAEAFRNEDLERAGALMNESHQSLRDLYEVSSEELDVMVEAAQAHPGCYGARLTGAGFGGCAIALVHCDATDAFVDAVRTAYDGHFDYDASYYITAPAAGAHLV